MNVSSHYTLICVGLLLAILVLSLIARHLAQKDLKLFSELSKKRKGKVYTDPFTSWATSVFPYKSAEVTVYQKKGVSGKRVKTCIKYPLELPENTALHITKGITGQTTVKELGQWLLVPKVQLGSEEFKKVFIVHGNDQDFLRRILGSELQQSLLKLKDSEPMVLLHSKKDAFYRKASGSLCKHMFEFSLNEVPDSIEELDKIVRAGLKIIDQINEFQAPAVETKAV